MRVRELHLFPVKAMAGQRVDSWPYDADGLLGDRAWGLVDGEGRIATGKESTRFRRYDGVFTWSGRVAAPGAVPEVSIDLGADPNPGADPDRATWWPADAPEAAAAVEASVGDGVRLLPREDSPYADDERGFKDDSPVSLVGTATLEALGAALGTGPVDPRHLRVNVVVETTEPYVEAGWVDGEIAIGGARFAVTKQVTRCRMVDVAQADVAALPGLLKATGARGAKAAVYLRPLGPGTLAVGDEVVPG